MRIRIAVLLCSLLVSLAATAQKAQTPEPSQSSSQTETSAGPITVRGCVNGGQERYTFTQQSTGTTFELQGPANSFESLRGRPVELTAREAPPSQKTGRNDLPKLIVSDVHAVPGQCPSVAGGGTSTVPTGAPVSVPDTQSAPTQKAQPTTATPRYGNPGAPNQTPPSVGNNPNVQGATGAPSPGTGNPPPEPPTPRNF